MVLCTETDILGIYFVGSMKSELTVKGVFITGIMKIMKMIQIIGMETDYVVSAEIKFIEKEKN